MTELQPEQYQMIKKYVDMGWSLIPIRKDGEKKPTIEWKEFQERRASWVEVTEWLDKGWYLAVVTGDISGVVVVDDDRVKHGLPEWGFDSAVVSKTQNGGKHYYFKYDREIHSTSNEAMRVDIKGWHSYVLLPPFNNREWVKEPFGNLDKLMSLPKDTETLIKPTQSSDYKRPFDITAVVGTNDGGRNDRLYAAAMSTFNKFDEKVAIDILIGLNNSFNPPLTVDEFNSQVSRAKQQVDAHPNVEAKLKTLSNEAVAGGTDMGDGRTDLGNAMRLARDIGNGVRYDVSKGVWLIWNGTRWEQDKTNKIARIAIKSADKRFKDAASLEDNEKLAEVKFSIKSKSKSKLEATIALTKVLHPIADSGEGWDADPMKLGCNNGIVDLRTGLLTAGVMEDKITMSTGIDYNLEATADRFLQFIDEIFEGNQELIHYVQKALGYSITGSNKEQAAFFCFGTGANGKSVLFKAISSALGEYSQDAPSSLFQRNLNNNNTNDVAATRNIRFLVASETLSSAKINEERIKKWTGGDVERARFLNKEFFSFIPTVKPWLFVNHKPRVDDDSYGFWRRMRIIPFDRVFKPSEQDPDLVDKLKEEKQGILNWLIEGCLMWQAEGLRPTPECVVVATNDYQADNDVLAEFIYSECIIDEEFATPARAMFNAYKRWAEGVGMKSDDVLAELKFARIMGDKFGSFRGSRDRIKYYKSVSLKSGEGKIQNNKKKNPNGPVNQISLVEENTSGLDPILPIPLMNDNKVSRILENDQSPLEKNQSRLAGDEVHSTNTQEIGLGIEQSVSLGEKVLEITQKDIDDVFGQ